MNKRTLKSGTKVFSQGDVEVHLHPSGQMHIGRPGILGGAKIFSTVDAPYVDDLVDLVCFVKEAVSQVEKQ